MGTRRIPMDLLRKSTLQPPDRRRRLGLRLVVAEVCGMMRVGGCRVPTKLRVIPRDRRRIVRRIPRALDNDHGTVEPRCLGLEGVGVKAHRRRMRR